MNINIVKQLQFSASCTAQIKLKKVQAEFHCVLPHPRYFAKKDEDLFLYIYRYHIPRIFNQGVKIEVKDLPTHWFWVPFGYPWP